MLRCQHQVPGRNPEVAVLSTSARGPTHFVWGTHTAIWEVKVEWRVLQITSQVFNSKIKFTGSRFQVPGSRFQVSNPSFQVSNVRFQISNSVPQFLVSGFWFLVSGFLTLVRQSSV